MKAYKEAGYSKTFIKNVFDDGKIPQEKVGHHAKAFNHIEQVREVEMYALTMCWVEWFFFQLCKFLRTFSKQSHGLINP